VAFLDEEEEVFEAPEAPGAARRSAARSERPRRVGRRGGRPPRPPAQALLVRRLIAVGIGLLFVILLVLGFRGCLNARKDRAIKNFVTDSSRIMSESSQTGQQFFSLFKAPTGRSPLEFENEVKSFRSAAQSSYDRLNQLNAPGEMSTAKASMKITLDLRRNALGVIADNIGAALGKENSSEAQQTIAEQMLPLIASDGVFTGATIPEISDALGDEGVAAQLKNIHAFVLAPPDQWLDPTTLATVFSTVNPESTAPTSGIHGLSLDSAKIGDTDLVAGGQTDVSSADPTLTVSVTNGGDSEETNIEVTVTVGGTPITKAIPKIGAGETTDLSIPITPVPPSGELSTVDVDVAAVPGETLTDNNSATYSVVFQ
jgi:CARDB protein